MSDKTRREHIIATIDDMVADFLYYDRKEDEDLPRGAIEEAIDGLEIHVSDIVNRFDDRLRKALGR